MSAGHYPPAPKVIPSQIFSQLQWNFFAVTPCLSRTMNYRLSFLEAGIKPNFSVSQLQWKAQNPR